MPFGRSYAGLDSLSAYRASVAQRMPTPSSAQYVGSMIFCRCSTCSAVVASSPPNMVNASQSSGATTSFPIVAAIRPAARIVSALQHEPHRHNGPSRAATVLPWPSGFSPSYMKFSTGSWRDVIVARRSRKSSASFDAPAMVSVRLSLRVRGQLTSLLWGNRARSPAGRKAASHPSFLSSRDLVLHQEQADGKEPAGAPVAAEGNRKDGGRERRPRPSGLRQPDDAQDWADQGPPKGTRYHYPNPSDHQILSIAAQPTPLKIAVQIYSWGLMTQMTVRHMQGEPLEKTLAWAEGEVEGYLRM